MLKVRNLSKYYNGLKAVDEISFKVKKGEITGFLGPNGAGKTTTLQMLTGYLENDEGKITYDKKNLIHNKQELLQDIGYLPENNPLYPNMRVDEFLLFIARVKQSDDKDKLKEITKNCGIKNVLTRPIYKLSKGYKQRVGLAKALIGNPKYLLLDEPTTGLDPNQKEEILKLIAEYSKRKIVLFSSHVLSEVSQIANRILIINRGQIVADGKGDDLVHEHFTSAQIKITTNAKVRELTNELEKVKTISKVKKDTKKRKKYADYTILCKDPADSALEVFNTIVKNKWKLTQLYTQEQGLNELFKELTVD